MPPRVWSVPVSERTMLRMGELSAWHWLIVIGVFVLLFGAQKLPDMARNLGRSSRILKAELRADKAPEEPPTP
jgi:sec-independent protein translocase protein TatA